MNLPRYVNDPFVDVGVAVLENRIGVSCDLFTREQMREQAVELAKQYTSTAWLGYLSVSFPNSGWCNATMGAVKKDAFRQSVLHSFEFSPLAQRRCVYCQAAAHHLADRAKIPLVSGETNMSNAPMGLPGVPVCAACLYAIQFYPLGTLKAEGKPLFWWIPEREWMAPLTARFQERLQQLWSATPESIPSVKWPKTRLLEEISHQLRQLEASDANIRWPDLRACHATNYGSNPDYDELRLPASVLRFLFRAQAYPAYGILLEDCWEKPPTKKSAKAKPMPVGPVTFSRNFFYEDLWRKDAWMQSEEFEPIGAASAYRKMLFKYFAPLVRKKIDGAFDLALVFVKDVLSMTQSQLDYILALADKIAASPDAAKHLNRIYNKRYPDQTLDALCDISTRMSRAGEAPFSTQQVLDAFGIVSSDDSTNSDFRLAFNILRLRLIERLGAEQLAEVTADDADGTDLKSPTERN